MLFSDDILIGQYILLRLSKDILLVDQYILLRLTDDILFGVLDRYSKHILPSIIGVTSLNYSNLKKAIQYVLS